MFDHVEPSSGRIADYPGKVDALGDDKEMVVFRSVEVEDTDPAMWPVLEHIEKHGLVLAEEITVDSPSMDGGRTVLRWYMSRGYRRDTMPAPGEMLEMWYQVNRTRPRGPLKDRTEYGTAAVFNEISPRRKYSREYRTDYGPAARYSCGEDWEVVGVQLRYEYADSLYDGRDFMPIAEAEQLRRDNPDLFWKIIDNDE